MSQYDQLLLFYKRLINMADDIKALIEKELFNEIQDKMQMHDKLLVQVKLARKCSKLSTSEQIEIDKFHEELRLKEKENIDLLQSNMKLVKVELDKLKLQNKLKKVYGQEYTNSAEGSIIDIDDSYRPDN